MAAKNSPKNGDEPARGGSAKALVLGLIILALGAFATVSVCDYHAGDPNLFLPEHPPGAAAGNCCGAVGANVAYHLVSTYGLAGFALPVLLFFWGFHVLVRKKLESPWRKLAGGALLMIALSTLAGALSAGGGWLYERVGALNVPTPFEGAPRAGGLLGYFGAGVLREPFGPVGIYLIVAGVIFLAMVLAAQRSVEWALVGVGHSAMGGLRLLAGRLRRAEAAEDDVEPRAAGRSRVRESGDPSVRATFGQSEEEMKRARRAAPPPEQEPLITIARVTEPPPPPETDEAKNQREREEIAKLAARASGAKPAARATAPQPAAPAAPPRPVIRNLPAAGDAAAERKKPRKAARRPAPRPETPPPPPARPAGVDYAGYKLPAVNLLDKVEHRAQVTNEVLTGRGQILVDTLKEFKIVTRLVSIDRGPAVTIYELELAAGVRIQRVMELADNLAMAMCSPNVRIIAPLPGRDSIGIEVPNTEREVVRLRPIIESKAFKSRTKEMVIPFIIGRDAAGDVMVEDLTRMPHLLVAGATGSGKSVCLNSFISTMLMARSPAEVKLLLVDPKMVEMSQYKGIPHLITPVITDMKRAAGVFEWATRKMDGRYELLNTAGVRDISRYNKLGAAERRARAEAADAEDPQRFSAHMPYLVIIVDELADLMMLASKEIERSITRLAQKSRGVGIHIILATQRPSVDVVTGLIKTNMPARIAFQVSSKVDSRTIIDQNGAEKLMGMGDMLYLPPTTSQLVRAKGTFVSDEEVARIAAHSRKQAPPDLIPELENITAGSAAGSGGAGGGLSDELFEEAVRVVLETRRGSVSLLQRRLGVGYTRAAKLIDMMAERDILGPYRGSKPREILIGLEEWESGSFIAGPVAAQRGDERPPQDIPDAEDYNEAEDYPDFAEQPEPAGSISSRM